MVVIRAAMRSDWARLFAWRNHPSTRAQFREQEPVALADHMKWLEETLRKKDVALYVGRDSARGVYVGTVRFDIDAKRKTAEVSVTVDPGQRGRGYAAAMIQAAIDETTISTAKVFVANVRHDNHASLRAFAECGFRPDEIGAEYVRMVR